MYSGNRQESPGGEGFIDAVAHLVGGPVLLSRRSRTPLCIRRSLLRRALAGVLSKRMGVQDFFWHVV